jgi:hypothetical protein
VTDTLGRYSKQPTPRYCSSRDKKNLIKDNTNIDILGKLSMSIYIQERLRSTEQYVEEGTVSDGYIRLLMMMMMFT